MKAMRRCGHAFMAALLCVCLLMSFVPSAAATSVSASGTVARSTVKISTQGLLVAGKSADVAASLQEIAADTQGAFDLKIAVSGAVGALSWEWTRVELAPQGDVADSEFFDTREVYPLSEAARQGTLEGNVTYRYTCTATDSLGSRASADILVATSSEYVRLELFHAESGVSLAGDALHYLVDLSVGEAACASPVYVCLQEAAAGRAIDGEHAWQVDLTGAPSGKAAFLGDVSISIPLSAAAAAASDVSVACFDASGEIRMVPNVAIADGSVSFTTDELGVFAVFYTPPGGKVATVTAKAGKGGSVFPKGSHLPYAAGSSPSFVLLPDAGYRVDVVLVDGVAVPELSGNQYSFAHIAEGAHSLEAYFARIEPAATAVTLTARVAGGNGAVQIDTDEPAASTSKTFGVTGASATVRFVPDAGYVVDRVTLDGTAVAVAGDAFFVAALERDATVEVSYKRGVPPLGVFHEVQASVVGGKGAVSPESAKVLHGSSATFSLAPAAGYHVEYVEANGRALVVEGSSARIDNVAGDCTVEVAFAADKPAYTLTASASAGGSISPSGVHAVAQGDSVVFNIQADSGFELSQLLVDGLDVSSAVSGSRYVLDDVAADHVVQASFAPVTVDPPKPSYAVVHASSNAGGVVSPAGDVLVELGAAHTFAILPDAGHRVARVLLDGFDVTADLDGSVFTIDSVTVDRTLRVEFEQDENPAPAPVVHKIEATATVGGVISPSGITRVVEGRDAAFLIKPDAGYKLAALEVDGARVDCSEAVYAFAKVSSDHVIKALFEKVPVEPADPQFVSIHAKAGANGSISPAGDMRVPQGSSQMFSFIPEAGYVVDSVKVDGVAVYAPGWSYTLFDVRAETSIDVTFKKGTAPQPLYHSVRAHAGAGGFVSPAGETKVVEGGSLLCAIQADEGYEIASVKVDGVEVVAALDGPGYRFDNITADHELAVAFRPSKDAPVQAYWNVTSTASAGGTVSPSGTMKVPDGASQTFFFLPDEGYKVSSLQVNGGVPMTFSGTSYTLFDVSCDASIAVAFEPDAQAPEPPAFYQVVAEAVAGSDGAVHGAVYPGAPASVAEGGALLTTFVPDAGWEVDEVAVDGTLVQRGGMSYRLVNVQADAHVSVSFKPSSVPDPATRYFSVSINIPGDRGGSVSASGTFLVSAGASKTFYVYPDDGYQLEAVLVNGDSVPFWPCADASSRARMAAQASAYFFTVSSITEEKDVEVLFSRRSGPPPVPVETCTVEARASSGGAIFASGTHTVPQGMPAEFSLKADAGFHLASLVKEVEGAGPEDVTSQVDEAGFYAMDAVEGDTALTATFAPDPVVPEKPAYVVVHAASSAGGAISPAGDVRVTRGGSQTFTIIPEAGHQLEALTVDGVPVVPIDGIYTLFDLEDDVVLEAAFGAGDSPFVPVTFDVTTKAASGGTVSPAGTTKVAQGSSLLCTILPDAGYRIDKVTDGGVDVTEAVANSAYRVVDVTSSRNVRVTFAPIDVDPFEPGRYAIEASAGGGGGISPEGAFEVDAGASQTFSLLPDAGYEVDTVVLDGVAVQTGGTSYVLADVRADHVVAVTFKLEEKPVPTLFEIVATVSGRGGKVSPEGRVVVAQGASASFAFLADAGYEVASVAVDGAALPHQPSSYVFDDVQADHAIEVSFQSVSTPGKDPSSLFGGADALVKQLLRTGDTPIGLWLGLMVVLAGAVAFAASCAARQSGKPHTSRSCGTAAHAREAKILPHAKSPRKRRR